MTLRTRLEIWQQYGGYLSGITRIAADMPELDFGHLLAVMHSQNYTGGWGRGALLNAFNAGRR